MPFARGTRFGPFEIDSPLGAGGMGEVYRARDTRLDRTVAIKVLPPQAAHPDSRARFEREARAISTLNHPNICTLHDVGSHDGVDYLVMELVDGETLAERIRRGPLPLAEVVRYGETLADALFAAHRQGIVHRDLKPGNVMVTRSGLKLLDFGLAKLCAGDPGRPELARSAVTTEAAPLTGAGLVMGTYQYMSPEQLEGREADARSDLWALGCVLFEMATGQRPFEGSSHASLSAAILQNEPPSPVSLQPSLPPVFERLVRRCLAKHPDDRWQNARDLGFALRSITETAPGGGVGLVAASPRSGHAARGVALAASLLAAAGIWWGLTRARPAEPPRLTRFTIQLPPGERLPTAMHPALALSPDGSLLAYVSERDNSSRLSLRWLDRLEAEPIPGTQGAASPFFSPDGQWIGFFAERKLKKVSVGGRAVTTLCDAPDAWGGTWRDDDTIVFNAGGFQGLSEVSAAGGQPRTLTVPDRAAGAFELQWPHAVPGGSTLYSVWAGSTFDQAHIEILPKGAAKSRVLIEGGFAPQYLRSGHLLYARRRGLFAAPFDRGRLELTGAPTRVLEGVSTSLTGALQAVVAGDGTLAYVPGGRDRSIVRLDRSGARRATIDTHGTYAADPALSPDGTRLALSVENEKGVDVWVADLARGTLARLTPGGGLHMYPQWSADGTRIAYSSAVSGNTSKVYWQPADGSAPAERLTSGDHIQWPGMFAPDGRALLWTDFAPDTAADIWVLPLAGDRTARPLLRTPANEDQPAPSPDGRYLAYASDESGRDEVYVVAADGLGAKWRVSTEGGREPRWIGDEILYRSGDRVMAAAIRTRPSVVVEKPSVRYEGWFESCTLPGCRSFDVTRDGDLIVLSGDPSPATEIRVVLGWFRELEATMAGPATGARR